MNAKKLFFWVLFLLISFELLFSLIIALGSQDRSFLCNLESPCDTVQNSAYGNIFGIKVAWFGVISFSVLLVFFLLSIAYPKYRHIFIAFNLIGLAFAHYFLYIQFFILLQLCYECIVIDFIMIVIALISLYYYFSFSRQQH